MTYIYVNNHSLKKYSRVKKEKTSSWEVGRIFKEGATCERQERVTLVNCIGSGFKLPPYHLLAFM